MKLEHGNITGAILAGGKSGRYGINKAFIQIGGIRIIDQITQIFRQIFQEIIIITNTPRDYAYLNIKIAQDIIPGLGPLGGIYTGLTYASNERTFTIACDMPFIKSELIYYMINLSGAYDVVVPKIQGRLQSLHAIYSKGCLPYIKELINSPRPIDRDNLRIRNFYDKVRVYYLEEHEIKPFDSDHLAFFNINTQEDLEKAEEIYRKLLAHR
ncbi:MAG TPA: molybdenum cofactor guanylyltransferase [Syntrophaceae bacterium]|nr:molybdenum cofactor guanylyltransferase [Syntrophaceae bacterium]